ncbi:hypothetical protein EDC01DRAFT_165280 [Geopyxis carbonaria]|nr:hypothetical protein EDC01DRAFT_165280 [Geopyxis carbonaria]
MNTPPGQMICPRMPSTPKHGSNFESPTGSPVRRRKQPAALKKEKSTSSQHTMSSQNSTGTLSPPPSSPIEPTATPRRSPRNMKRARFIIEEDEEKTTVTDDESDHERTSTRPTMINAGGMGLATPAKTPRRRKLPPADFASSSKVLFKSTTTTTTTTISKATTSKVVPRTPKKDIFASLKTSTPVRHIRKPSQIEIDEREEKEIEIFTDSDARRPKKGLDTNPFAKTGRASRSSARLRGERAEKFNELGEHAHRTDGMYYIFRGKKVFRSFDNLPNMESRGVENDEDGLNPADIKPRLLFPTVSNEEEENDDDVEHDVAHADIDNDEEKLHPNRQL